MIIMIISLDTTSILEASEDASHPQVVGQQQTLQLLIRAFIVYIRLVYLFFLKSCLLLFGAEGKYSYAVYLGVAILIIILC